MSRRSGIVPFILAALTSGCRRAPTPENVAGRWELRHDGLVAQWELNADGSYALTSTLSAQVTPGAKEDATVREKGRWKVEGGKLVIRVTGIHRFDRWETPAVTRTYEIERLTADSLVIARERKLGPSPLGKSPPVELRRLQD